LAGDPSLGRWGAEPLGPFCKRKKFFSEEKNQKTFTSCAGRQFLPGL